jgi:cytochrome P450
MNSELSNINPYDPEIIENPWEFFDLLRREAPVYAMPNQAYYLISRYDDIMKIVMDTETFSSNLVAVVMGDKQDDPEVMNISGGNNARATDVLAIADPPNHTRQRRVSNRAFTMRRVQAMEPAIEELCNQLIDRFKGKQVDWVSDFSVPLPMIIIMQLLGFPLEDMDQCKEWSDASVALLSGINSEDQLAAHTQKINQMMLYLADKYDENLANPGDNLLGDLIREASIDDDDFGRDEIVSMLVQLLSAGNETTTSLIGSAMKLLLQEPDLQHQLRNEPLLIENFIEEALRLESPFHGHFRVVKKETEIAGTPLHPGDRLMLLWSSANRDQLHFDSPESTNLERPKPRSHLSFGYGIHHCIGANLARTEARIAFKVILERTSNLSLSPDNDFRHIPSLFVRSLARLNIEVDS